METETMQTLTRTAFDALNPADRMTFIKGGGTLTDTAPADSLPGNEAPHPAAQPLQMSRAAFDNLSSTDRMTFIKGGGTVTDTPPAVS
jgi:hypothetical protein